MRTRSFKALPKFWSTDTVPLWIRNRLGSIVSVSVPEIYIVAVSKHRKDRGHHGA